MAALGTYLASMFQRLPTNFYWVGGLPWCFAITFVYLSHGTQSLVGCASSLEHATCCIWQHFVRLLHWLVAITPKSSSAAVMTERSALVVAALHVTCVVCTNKTLAWNACILAFADNQYRTGGHDDHFGLEDYRKIVYASKPDPKEEEFDLDPHNNCCNITHLTAHQLAFVEIKASSAA